MATFAVLGQQVVIDLDGTRVTMIVDSLDDETGAITLTPKPVPPPPVYDGRLYYLDLASDDGAGLMAGEVGFRETRRGMKRWHVAGFGRVSDNSVTVMGEATLVRPQDLWLRYEMDELVVPQDDGPDMVKNIHEVADDLWGGLGGPYWEAVGLSLLGGCGGQIAHCCPEHNYHVRPHNSARCIFDD